MPWLVSMRMMGDVIGTPRSVAIRMSVIFRSDGLELVLVFCGSASSVSSTRNPAVSAPAACLKKERRPWMALAGNTVVWKLLFVIVSSILFALGCCPNRSVVGGRELPRPLQGSPVEFHRDLHAAPGVRLGAPQAEVGVLQRAAPAQRTKLGTVQQVEGLPSDVQVLLLLQRKAPCHRDALAEARQVSQFGVVSRNRAQRVRRLGAKERSRLQAFVHRGVEFAAGYVPAPAVQGGHRGPVAAVEYREADGGSQPKGCPALVVLNSRETPAAHNGRPHALLGQELSS